MRVKLRKSCSLAEEEHQQNIRYYAHTYHYKDTICVCKAFWDLPKEYRDGIIYHEFGHLLAGPSGSEQDANKAAEAAFGTKIEYVDSPYGRRLERLANMRRNNPETGVWIPVHAVKFNENGSVSLLGEHAANPAKLRPRLPTIKQAKQMLRGLGLTLSKRGNEYRVNFIDGDERTAYYTNDLLDAIKTGETMSTYA